MTADVSPTRKKADPSVEVRSVVNCENILQQSKSVRDGWIESEETYRCSVSLGPIMRGESGRSNRILPVVAPAFLVRIVVAAFPIGDLSPATTDLLLTMLNEFSS